MRLTRLDLLRFGKFTDKSIFLPTSPRDFHLIVGPNEAGKSTLRSAIQDLLFGIETRSRYNFLHAHTDMRVGALIHQGSLELDFVRIKARVRTLQRPDGTALPEEALVSFMGTVDRVFFDQMFGLNHDRLVKGGQDILSASNNMGQILFQAAAGIGSLGAVRDQLEQEADGLWGPRKSDKRAYYLAANALEQAEAALKHATVRTRDWQDASDAVQALSAQLQSARARYDVLAQQRFQLERVRRVAPLLSRLALIEAQLLELGPVALLPAHAAEQVALAEHDMAMATQSLTLFESHVLELKGQLAGLTPDTVLLARAPDIEALSAFRQKVSQHDADIAKREAEIRVQWLEVQESARQLSWPAEDEEATAQRLPDVLVRVGLEDLLRRHGGLHQTQSAADEALTSRQEEIKAVQAEIALLPTSTPPVALVDALAEARGLGDVLAQMQRLETQIARGERELRAAQRDLGTWPLTSDQLCALALPGQDECSVLIARRAALQAELQAVQARQTEVRAEEKMLALGLLHFRAAHQPVTQTEVMALREQRDASWQAIKSGELALLDGAAGYERTVTQADHLADVRHSKAQEETELQSRLDQMQRLQLQLGDLAEREQAALALLSGFDENWRQRLELLGLPGMALVQMNEWRATRERVLLTTDTLTESRALQADFCRYVAQVTSNLKQTLRAASPTEPAAPEADPTKLSALILQAEQWIGDATRAQERRDTLNTQSLRAQASVQALGTRAALAREAMTGWMTELHQGLARAHLPQDASLAKVQAAVALQDRMLQHLQKIRETRLTRINLMRQDLDEFARAARALARDIAPDLALVEATDISMELDARLKVHAAQSQTLDRVNAELGKATAQVSATEVKIAQSQASLAPLLQASGTTQADELRQATVKSDRLRQLTSGLDDALQQLLNEGDGLSRDALAAECALTDAATVASCLSDNQRQTDDIVQSQNSLSGALTGAQAILGKIAGQGAAAQAESRRQEALARMGNALERYIKVFTAAKLLRWSIEKFRETRQGPMLAQASQIFMGLTQGAFSKLAVDYESDPPRLSGQRASGEHVDIEGMSEGTRDQLYLALRLAALSLHLEKTAALPFIADDLFINYDDGRARAGLEALARLSESTQVIFLSHHAHLVPVVQAVFGAQVNVVQLD